MTTRSRRRGFPADYLAARKSLDDRALNRHVWERLRQALAQSVRQQPLRVLEVGCGVGTMLERLLEWGLFEDLCGSGTPAPRADSGRIDAAAAPRRVAVTAIDLDAAHLAHARHRLPDRAADLGFDVQQVRGGALHLARGGLGVSIHLEAADLFEWAARQPPVGRWDLVLAHALLDLVDAPTALSALRQLARSGGLLYATLTFDGATILLPEFDPFLDESIERLYHQSMDRRTVHGRPSGHSRAGRHLFHALRSSGALVLAMGGSDWTIFPTPGGYTPDERVVLHYILDNLERTLSRHPALDPTAFAAWLARRREQLANEDLVFLARHVDVLAQFS